MGKINYKDSTLLLLRLSLVFIFVYHGLPKIINPSGSMSFFSTQLGLPASMGPIIGIVEVGAAVLILIGLWHKWANYALALVMVGAMVLVQIPALIKSGSVSAGFERDLMILVATLVLAANGPGHLAIKKK